MVDDFDSRTEKLVDELEAHLLYFDSWSDWANYGPAYLLMNPMPLSVSWLLLHDRELKTSTGTEDLESLDVIATMEVG